MIQSSAPGRERFDLRGMTKKQKEMIAKLDRYFETATVADEKSGLRLYSLAGICGALGVTKQEFYAMEDDRLLAPVYRYGAQKLERNLEELALLGKLSGSFCTFYMKSQLAWAEKEKKQPKDREVEVTIFVKGPDGSDAGKAAGKRDGAAQN